MNQTLSGSGESLYLVEEGTNRLVADCTLGTTCIASVIPHVATSTVTFDADIAPSGLSGAPTPEQILATSSATAPGWSVALSASVTDDGIGPQISLVSVPDYEIGEGYWLYLVEPSDNTRIGQCIVGLLCTANTAPHGAGSATYVAEVATAGYTTPPPPSQVLAASAVIPEPAWGVQLTSRPYDNRLELIATTNYDVLTNVYTMVILDVTTGTWSNFQVGTSYGALAAIGAAGDEYEAFISSTDYSLVPIAHSNILNAPDSNGPDQSDGGGNPSRNENTCPCADPVQPSTGEFYESSTDLAMATAGPALALTRTYSTQHAAFDGPFGFGWSSLLNMSLSGVAAPASQVTVQQENGSEIVFTLGGSTYSAPASDFATLVHNGDGTWTFTRRARQVFTFTAAGQLASISDLNGETVTAGYDGSGRIATLGYGDRTITISYGSDGRVASATDGAGHTVNYTYDSAGNLASVTDAAGATTAYTYDAFHDMLTATKPDGGETQNTYDLEGRVTQQVTPLGTTTFGYSGNDTAVTSPRDNVTQFVFTDGQMTSKTAGYGTAAAATSTYTYDPTTGSVASVTDPRSHTTSYTYDLAGNILTEHDNLNQLWSWTYDSLDDQTSATNPDEITTTATYDTDGNLTGTSTPIDTTHTATVSYAHAVSGHPGLVSSVTDARGKTTTFGYDSDGDLTSVTDPDGDQTTSTYDGDGRPVTTTSPRGNASIDPADYTTTTTYDGDDRPLTVTAPGGRTTTYTYDSDGNTLTVTDPKSQVTTDTYNTADELTVEHRPDSSTIHQAYDADGDLTSVTDPGGNVTSYGYDSLDRMVSQTTPATAASPSGITTTYTLDGDGNATAVAQPGPGSTTLTTTNAYDANNELTSVSYSDGTTPNVSYTYTPEGQRATMVDGTGTSHYTYNQVGWLTTTTDGGGHAVGYGYDLDGNATTVTYPNGQSVNRSFDADDLLSGVTDWNSKTTSFGYNADSDLTTIGYPNGVTETTTYDKADDSSSIADTTSTATIASSVLARDADDELTGVTTSGTLVGPSTTYGYNQLGQLTTYKVGTAAATPYGYDGDENLATLPGGTSQSFDAAHELTDTGAATVTSDIRGNLASQVSTSGTASYFAYDQANRITDFYSIPSGVFATYAYNGDGLRTSKHVNGTVSTYTWDTTTGTPLLLSDGSNSYLYGPGGLPIEQIDSTGTPTYLQHDQQGSTTMLTNAAGTAVGVYVYAPYGATTIYVGTVATPLRYDGQYQDNESGLYYLRARYYNPATGQFTTRDPLEASTGQPYEYANDNPLSYADPPGLFGCGIFHSVCSAASDAGSYVESHPWQTSDTWLAA